MMFAAVSLFAMSCEPKDAPEQEVEFQITSDTTVTMDAEGGTFVIAYTISGDDYNNVTAEADDTEIINAINTNQKGYIVVSVSENESYSERSAAVRITYGEHSAIIRVNQAARVVNYEVVNIAANQLVGKYYGDNIKEGVGHYWIILTKDGFVDGAAVAGGEYFRLDLLAPMPTDESNVRIPDGEYRFASSQNFEEFTIVDIGNTDYSWVDDQMEGWALPLADASLTVKANRFELVAVVESKEYHVAFEGDYSLTTTVITEHVSSLTEDTVIDVSNCNASANSVGLPFHSGHSSDNISATFSRIGSGGAFHSSVSARSNSQVKRSIFFFRMSFCSG